jgi:glycosyltransferase involved in cell wall biosynthesis
MADRNITLSIVVPAYNEETRIGAMLDAYLPFFSARYADTFELIVVVNGSVDATEQVVRSYMAEFSQLQLIVDPEPIGKGGAVIEGFRAARGECVGYVDADGSTPPPAFLDLVEAAADSPVVIASRWCRGAVIDPPQPFVRRVTSRVFNLTVRILFGLRLTDTQCGAKVMQRCVVESILPQVGVAKWAFDVDLLFQIRRAGYTVKELPTLWHDVAGSKLDVTEASIEMLFAVVRLRLLFSPFRFIVGLYDSFLLPVLPYPWGERKSKAG